MQILDLSNSDSWPELMETPEAALAVRRAAQTLRVWAMKGNGPIQPVRFFGRGGRLVWRKADILRLINADGEH